MAAFIGDKYEHIFLSFSTRTWLAKQNTSSIGRHAETIAKSVYGISSRLAKRSWSGLKKVRTKSSEVKKIRKNKNNVR